MVAEAVAAVIASIGSAIGVVNEAATIANNIYAQNAVAKLNKIKAKLSKGVIDANKAYIDASNIINDVSQNIPQVAPNVQSILKDLKEKATATQADKAKEIERLNQIGSMAESINQSSFYRQGIPGAIKNISEGTKGEGINEKLSKLEETI